MAMDKREAYRWMLKAELSKHYRDNMLATHEAGKAGREYCLWPVFITSSFW